MATGDRIDLILLGATGFTGKYGVEMIARLAEERKDFTWGVAGRNKAKLKTVLEEAANKTGLNLSNIPVIKADVGDHDSLVDMARQARVVVNYVGPYSLYGEPVVKACVEGGAHQVDVSAEPLYIERMEYLFNKEAEEKGVYVVSACGFDSVPSDMGAEFLRQQFQGELNSVETYLTVTSPGGTAFHYATWESLINGVAQYGELQLLREQLYPKKVPKLEPKLKKRSTVHYSEVLKQWCLPCPGSDHSILSRSQRFFFEKQKKRPVQVESYFSVTSLFGALVLLVGIGLVALLSRCRPGMWLLETFPSFFSFGMMSHAGPTQENMENTHFLFTLCGAGWSEKLAEPTDNYKDPPNKTMTVTVKGTDPGYGAANVMLLACALTLLKEQDKIPGKGGVLTTASAFHKTNLVKELNKRGVTFEVVKD